MPELSNALGRYEVLHEIGRGGMATVYLARQVDLDRLVALKELGGLRSTDPAFTQRFLREARLAGSLSHPNIVTVHDFFEQRGVPVIAMEYLRRGSLRPYVGSLSLAQVGGVLQGLLAGLAHAETHGIVHRDLKPENLLVTEEGTVKIVDFGVAKATSDVQAGTFVTSTGIALGTPNYVAPEQAMAREVGPWTDLYSVGIVTFELFAGRAPFADTPEPMAVLLRQVNESVPPLSEIHRNVHPVMSEWVEWLLAKDPSARPQTARQAWLDLDERLASILERGWQRDASLPEPDPSRTALPTAAAPLQNEMATRAPTVMPQPHSWQGTGVDEPPSRRPRSPLWRGAGALVLVALALVALVATQRVRDSSQPSVTTQPMADTIGAATKSGSAQGSAEGSRGSSARGGALRSVAQQYQTAAANVAAVNARSPTTERAALVAALRDTAAAYRRAAGASARNDQAGYFAALDAAEAGKTRVELASDLVGSRNAATPSPDSGTQPSTQDGSCAGDESSDDPSDDSCDP